MNMYTLRLKVEDKQITKSSYDSSYAQDIIDTVRKAAVNFNIPHYIFETYIRTHDGRLNYCAFRMTDKIFKFFCNAYGSRKVLEKDYQVTEHK